MTPEHGQLWGEKLDKAETGCGQCPKELHSVQSVNLEGRSVPAVPVTLKTAFCSCQQSEHRSKETLQVEVRAGEKGRL